MSAPRPLNLAYPVGVDVRAGRLLGETDEARHIDHLVRQVLFTAPGERINRPSFGCGLRRMVFAPNGTVSASLTRVAVFQALDQWLGDRIRVEAVEAEAQDEVLFVKVAYQLRATGERRVLNLEVTP